VHETILKSGWETALVAVPFIGMLLVGLFRLDELVAAPKRKFKERRSRTFAGTASHAYPSFSDPDGRPWRRAQRAE
jgi:hypothetical protein